MRPNFFVDDEDEAIAKRYFKKVNSIGFVCVGLALTIITMPHPERAAWFAFAVAIAYAFSHGDAYRKIVAYYLSRYKGFGGGIRLALKVAFFLLGTSLLSAIGLQILTPEVIGILP
ncbi:hypothetical protein F0170_00365 [Pseudomonas sp. MAFF 730085]|uniref:Uncharacterized protein n=1 Tax=Pseudomonas kitaguniensis TaxID=2607908 RepID=A0A5N7JMF6_9PSED|nr:hypothetical protein [Pseudomonas kitaguniensis]MPQ82577.1 hypothetical protein [Pseudomonas kitaguniensis]